MEAVYPSALGGLVIGLLFGVVMQQSRFCLVGAVSSALLIRDLRHGQAYLAAWAVAIGGTTLLEVDGLVDIAQTSYRSGALDWLGSILGGLMFGFGATLAGGCASRSLVIAAEGHLGGVLTLLTMFLFAGISMYGMLEPARVWLLQHTALEIGDGDLGLASLLSLPVAIPGLVIPVVLLLLIPRLGPSIVNRWRILGGAALGLLVVAGWWLTGSLTQDELAPVAASSVRITGPMAEIHYLLATGTRLVLGFGLTFLIGLFLGAMASARFSGRFHWHRPDPSRISAHLVGGSLMGMGAVLAGGCNIGQGLSGASTLSLASLLAGAAIFLGVILGTKWWERQSS